MTGVGQTDQDLRTIAVLVTYQPDLAELERTLRALTGQVDGLVLVDNGSGDAVQAAIAALLRAEGLESDQKQTLFQPENGGLGQAHNSGIAVARSRLQADFILLCDQDSHPAADMVAHLQGAMQVCRDRGGRPAVMGPNFTEPKRARADILPPGAAHKSARQSPGFARVKRRAGKAAASFWIHHSPLS